MAVPQQLPTQQEEAVVAREALEPTELVVVVTLEKAETVEPIQLQVHLLLMQVAVVDIQETAHLQPMVVQVAAEVALPTQRVQVVAPQIKVVAVALEMLTTVAGKQVVLAVQV